MRHQGFSWRARVVALLAGVATISLVPAAAASADPIADKRAQAQQLATRLDQLGTKLEQLAEKYNAARIHAESVQSQVNKAAAGVAKANQQLTEQKAALRGVALQAYIGRVAGSGVDAGSTVTDVAVQHVYVDSVASRQQDTLDGLRQAKLDLTDQQQKLAKVQGDAKAAVAAVEQQRKAAASVEAAQAAQLSKVKGELATLVAAEQQRRAAAEAARARQEMLRIQAQNQAASRSRALAAAAARTAALATPASRSTGIADVDDNDTAPVAGHGAAAAIAEAQRQIGKPYRWGGSGPGSFDCSGLTAWAWRAAGVSLPHNTVAQYNATTHIPLSAIQPGDLLFYGSDMHHMGLYVGNGQMIEAPHSGLNVRYAPIYRRDFVAASRPSA